MKDSFIYLFGVQRHPRHGPVTNRVKYIHHCAMCCAACCANVLVLEAHLPEYRMDWINPLDS